MALEKITSNEKDIIKGPEYNSVVDFIERLFPDVPEALNLNKGIKFGLEITKEA